MKPARLFLLLAALAFAPALLAQQATLGTISNFQVSTVISTQTNTWDTNGVAVITPKILEAQSAVGRKWLRIANVGSPTVAIAFGSVLTNGQPAVLTLASNATFELNPSVRWNGAVSARSLETNAGTLNVWHGY
jgi:hypothetical protein